MGMKYNDYEKSKVYNESESIVDMPLSILTVQQSKYTLAYSDANCQQGP